MNEAQEVILTKLMSNPILSEVIQLFIEQQEKGLAKYGELVNLDSYSLIGWIEHAQQECVDKLVYLECVKQKAIKEKTTSGG